MTIVDALKNLYTKFGGEESTEGKTTAEMIDLVSTVATAGGGG